MAKVDLVMQAIIEVSGLPENVINDFIDNQIAEAKKNGTVWTRTGMMKQFRREGSPTGIVIARLESERKKPKQLEILQ